MPHNSRRPAQFPRIASVNSLKLPIDLRSAVDGRTAGDMERLRYNIRFVCFARGYSLTYVINQLKKEGISFHRNSIMYGGRKRSVSTLYLSTWAFVLDVPTWLLLSESIESDCERLGIKRI